MSLSINSNSFLHSNNIGKARKSQSEALKRLSSMQRINSAKDNAAGLAITQRQTAQIRGTEQAIRNTYDGISFMQTAESGLGQVTSNLQRMRELAVQAANGSQSAGDRHAIQAEVNQLSEENSRVNSTSSFAGQPIFSNNGQTQTFQTGANAGSENQVTTSVDSLENLNSVSGGEGSAIDLSSVDGAQRAIEQIDADIASVSAQASDLGAYQNRFSSIISNSEQSSINTQASRSRIADTDAAKEMSNLIRSQILEHSSIAAASHANTSNKLVLSLLGQK